MRDKYRVTNKSNVNFAGKKTSYKLFVYSPDHNTYLYESSGFARGYNASDAACIADYEHNTMGE